MELEFEDDMVYLELSMKQFQILWGFFGNDKADHNGVDKDIKSYFNKPVVLASNYDLEIEFDDLDDQMEKAINAAYLRLKNREG